MAQLTVQQAMELATQHLRAGRLQQAEAIFRQVLTAQPDHPEALNLLGAVSSQMGQPQAAIDLIRRAIAINPSSPIYHNNLGNAFRAQGDMDQAIEAYRKALSCRPDFAQAHFNLGIVLQERFGADEAIGTFRETTRLMPQFVQAFHRLGHALQQTGQTDQAIAAYRRALELQSDAAETHFNLGLALLQKGDFEHGWPEHEWRLKSEQAAIFKQTFAEPRWDGSELRGQRILLYGEQGFGDTIQFARYVPLVASRGGRVILGVRPELRELLKSLDGIDQIVAGGDPMPEFDLHCPLLSLPFVFGTRVEAIPSQTPYIRADAEKSSRWRVRMAEVARGLKVGLTWAGVRGHENDRNRSLPFTLLAPLMQTPSVSFFSLQKGVPPSPGSPGEGRGEGSTSLLDWTQDIDDFSDTASLMDNLDLIITVDTAVAHLAGALGKPVWVLLPHVADWRWMLDREDSPWYPTMRLFRQPEPSDWETPLREAVESLHRLCANPHS